MQDQLWTEVEEVTPMRLAPCPQCGGPALPGTWSVRYAVLLCGETCAVRYTYAREGVRYEAKS
jgi:hypothetical protein